MTTFEEREKGYESKFAQDAKLRFKVEARRNKKLGLWAAELLGKSGDDAQSYAGEVIRADFDEPGDEDVFRKVAGDLGDKVSEKELRRTMERLLDEAKHEIIDLEDNSG